MNINVIRRLIWMLSPIAPVKRFLSEIIPLYRYKITLFRIFVLFLQIISLP